MALEVTVVIQGSAYGYGDGCVEVYRASGDSFQNPTRLMKLDSDFTNVSETLTFGYNQISNGDFLILRCLNGENSYEVQYECSVTSSLSEPEMRAGPASLSPCMAFQLGSYRNKTGKITFNFKFLKEDDSGGGDSGGGDSGGYIWDWGKWIKPSSGANIFTGSASGAAALSAYAIDYLGFQPPQDGFLEVVVVGTGDLVLCLTSGNGGLIGDQDNPNNLIDCEYQKNQTGNGGGETYTFEVHKDENWLIAWYDYYGAKNNMVYYELIFYPNSWTFRDKNYGIQNTTNTIQVNPGLQEIERIYFTPKEDGTLTITSNSTDDVVGWLTMAQNELTPSTGAGQEALEGNYMAYDDDRAGQGNFLIEEKLTKDQEYIIYTHAYSANINPAAYNIILTWKADLISLSYDGNGAIEGIPEPQFTSSGNSIQINNTVIPIRNNYIFKGWSLNPADRIPNYGKNQQYEIELTKDTTLYAIWWPDFNWNKKNYEEANQLNNYISTYIGITNNNELKTGDLYTLTWINNILSILKQTQLERTMLIKQEQMDNIVDKYKNYEET